MNVSTEDGTALRVRCGDGQLLTRGTVDSDGPRTYAPAFSSRCRGQLLAQTAYTITNCVPRSLKIATSQPVGTPVDET